MSLHKENSFETEICQHLADHGWLYSEHPQGVRRGCKDAAPRDTPSDKASTTTQHDAAGYDPGAVAGGCAGNAAQCLGCVTRIFVS